MNKETKHLCPCGAHLLSKQKVKKQSRSRGEGGRKYNGEKCSRERGAYGGEDANCLEGLGIGSGGRMSL